MALQLDRLQGPDISASRLQDNIRKALNAVGAIAVNGQLATDVTIPSAGGTVPNPLGRKAQGILVVLQNQPCSIMLLSSTSSTLTVAVALVPTQANGIITGLFPLTGNLVASLWVF